MLTFNEDLGRVPQVRSVLAVLAVLRDRPLCSQKEIANRCKLSIPTVSKALQTLMDTGLVHELTGQRRNRFFAYTAYLEILNEET